LQGGSLPSWVAKDFDSQPGSGERNQVPWNKIGDKNFNNKRDGRKANHMFSYFDES
jgi:hypothetical protein